MPAKKHREALDAQLEKATPDALKRLVTVLAARDRDVMTFILPHLERTAATPSQETSASGSKVMEFAAVVPGWNEL